MLEGKQRRFYSWIDTPDKNHQGGLMDSPDDPANNVVHLIEIYATHRPVDAPDSFYLQVNTASTGIIWFKKTKIGENMVNDITKEICTNLGFEGHFTNHSWRRRIPTLLYQANINQFRGPGPTKLLL